MTFNFKLTISTLSINFYGKIMSKKFNLSLFEPNVERDFLNSWSKDRKSKVSLLTESEYLVAKSFYQNMCYVSCATSTFQPSDNGIQFLNQITELRKGSRNEFIGTTLSTPEVNLLVIGNTFEDSNYGKKLEHDEDITLIDISNKLKIKYRPHEFEQDFPIYKGTHKGDKSHFKKLNTG